MHNMNEINYTEMLDESDFKVWLDHPISKMLFDFIKEQNDLRERELLSPSLNMHDDEFKSRLVFMYGERNMLLSILNKDFFNINKRGD